MNGRVVVLSSTVIALLLLVTGCSTSSQLSSIAVTPATAMVQTAGATAQFQATGTFSNGKTGSQNTQNLTTQVIWSSSSTNVATINSSGLATAVNSGVTTISATGGNGGIVGTAILSVTLTGGGGGGQGSLTSLKVIPTNQPVNVVGETAQFIAIGSFSGSPSTQDLTDQVTWSSSDVRVATINAAGLATAVGSCVQGAQTTITALSPPSFGGAISATATVTNSSCGTNNLPSLTVYEVGLGTGTVTSAPPPIVCGPSEPQSSCTGNFTLGTAVTLVASPTSPGSVFGGFSANCTAVLPDPNSCTKQSNVSSCTCSVNMTDNVTVGAIFNTQ